MIDANTKPAGPAFEFHHWMSFLESRQREALTLRFVEEWPTALTAEQSLRFRVRGLIDAFNGPFGKIVAGLIAEGQGEPSVLKEFFDRWVSPRRNATIADLQRGKDAEELGSDTEPELLNDAIFGAIYYRMLLRSGPLTRRFGEELVEQVIRGHRSGKARK